MGSLCAAAMKYSVLLVVLLLAVCGDCRIPRGSKREEKGPRVWHQSVTETETECGNFTSLYREEKPSQLCTEVNNTLCVCSTRNTVTRDGETQVEEDAEWSFKCGTCKLRLVFDEKENEDEDRTQKKKKQKMTKSEKKRIQERSKMRRKIKGKQQNKKEKTKRKRNEKKDSPAEPRNDQ